MRDRMKLRQVLADLIVDPSLAGLAQEQVGEGRELLADRADTHADGRREDDGQFHAREAEAFAVNGSSTNSDTDRRARQVALIDLREDGVDPPLVQVDRKLRVRRAPGRPRHYSSL